MELHHDKHHAAYVKGANDGARASSTRRATRTTSRGLAASRRRSPSTSPGTCCTRSSGRTSRPRAAASPRASSPTPSTATSAASTAFKRSSTEAAVDRHGLRLGRARLGAARRAAADDADLRPPVQLEPGRRAAAGARRLGARLLPAVPEPQKSEFFEAVWNVWNWEDVVRAASTRRVRSIPCSRA